MRFGGLALVAMCSAPVLGTQLATAQVAPTDPAEAVRRVAERIEAEMQEIDRLLREARPPYPENSLAQARSWQGNVTKDIDELLDELHKFCCTCPGGT